MWYFDVNSEKTDYLMPSSPSTDTCRFKTRPSPLSIMGENACGAHFLQRHKNDPLGTPALTQGYILTWVSFSFLFFLEYPITKL